LHIGCSANNIRDVERVRAICQVCHSFVADVEAGEHTEMTDRWCPDCNVERPVRYEPIGQTVTLSHGVDARIVAPWDGLTLTLAAAIYAVLATVAGVVVAMLGTGGSRWWWAGGYAIVVLALLGAGLLRPQKVIGFMKRVLGAALR
jgi:hypothetical protein